MSEVYNPLDKLNLARSIEIELLARPVLPLSTVDQVLGAGVYVIYYTGTFPAYAAISNTQPLEPTAKPIYIGKAIPRGGRKGGISVEKQSANSGLRDRLSQHRKSIEEATNLDIADFQFRYLVVDDIWIPLGENMLIETFKPVWNRAIDGFGNKDPGRRRKTQLKSPWDVLHPGRSAAVNTTDSPTLTAELLLRRVED